MAGDLARGNDRVGTLGDNTSRARHTEESSGRCGESGSQAEDLSRSVHLGDIEIGIEGVKRGYQILRGGKVEGV